MWLLATRNRPDRAKELIEAMLATGDVPDVAVMMDCAPYDIEWPAHWHIHSSDEHLELQRAWNGLFRLHPDEKTYGLITDHARPKSLWSKALEAAAGDWGMAFCHDNHKRVNPMTGRRRIPAASCYGGELVRKMGYVWPDFCTHMYGDDALEEIGHSLGIVTFCESVIVDDLLSKKGEFPLDDNNRRLYKGRVYVGDDGDAFADWMAHDKGKLLEGIRKCLP